MPTHYHLLLRIKFLQNQLAPDQQVAAAFSHAMQNFLISYTRAINKRFSRVGALFQGPFKRKRIIWNSFVPHDVLYKGLFTRDYCCRTP
jgi:hypothetical protein